MPDPGEPHEPRPADYPNVDAYLAAFSEYDRITHGDEFDHARKATQFVKDVEQFLDQPTTESRAYREEP